MKDITKENPEILNKYITYLHAVKNYSSQTIKNYNYNILQFLKFLLEYWNMTNSIRGITISILSNVKESDIMAYLVYLNYFKDSSPKTRKSKIDSLRSFFKYICNTFVENKIENPTSYLPSIQQNLTAAKYLNLENAKKIKNIFNKYNSHFPTRDNLIITLFLNTGMRLSELRNINVDDVNFENKTIRITGKGYKERILFLNTDFLNNIKKYINIRLKKQKVINKNEPLLVNKYGNRFGQQGIEDICKKAFELAGLADYNYTVHSLRHTVATQLYMNNVDIYVIKEFLGHSNIDITTLYCHVDDLIIKEAVEKNPLANFKCKKTRKRKGGVVA